VHHVRRREAEQERLARLVDSQHGGEGGGAGSERSSGSSRIGANFARGTSTCTQAPERVMRTLWQPSARAISSPQVGDLGHLRVRVGFAPETDEARGHRAAVDEPRRLVAGQDRLDAVGLVIELPPADLRVRFHTDGLIV